MKSSLMKKISVNRKMCGGMLMALMLCTAAFNLNAQQVEYPGYSNGPKVLVSKRDSTRGKHFFRASSQLLMAEVLPFTYDRYIRNVDYARISLKSIGYNLSPAHWAWDGDEFGTNEIAHPYHGHLYFSAFRTNGYSFWQSAPAAFAGSYIWETFGESEYFSPNDFINTSIGGIILGEMTYRLANKIIDRHVGGPRRQATEVIAMLINPMNGLRRIMDKKWGKVAGSPVRPDSSRIYSEFDLGMRNFSANNSRENFGWYARVRLLYVSLNEGYRTPFSRISVNAEFGRDDSSKINVLSVYGTLAGWTVAQKKKLESSAVLSANYDYIKNEAFYYSAQSLKLNLYTDFVAGKRFDFKTSAGIGPVILAAVPDTYGYRGRRYAYGTGLGVNAGCAIGYAERLFLNVNYRGGLIKTINGNPSHFFLHSVTAELRCRIKGNLSLCGEPGYLTLRGHYKYESDVNQSYPYLRFSLRYNM
jgi:hypothetical protein